MNTRLNEHNFYAPLISFKNIKQHDKYFIYQHREHVGKPEAKEKKRGIKNYVKSMIKECIFEKDISLPAKIRIKLMH